MLKKLQKIEETSVINDNYCTINSTRQGGELTYSFHSPELVLTRRWRAGEWEAQPLHILYHSSALEFIIEWYISIACHTGIK